MKQYIIFTLLCLGISMHAQDPNDFGIDINQIIQKEKNQELKALQNDPKNMALLEKITVHTDKELEKLEKEEQWLDSFFARYGNKPEDLLDSNNPQHSILKKAYLLGKSEHLWICTAFLPCFILGLIKPKLITSFTRDKNLQKITADHASKLIHHLVIYDNRTYDKEAPPKESALTLSIKSHDVLAGLIEYASDLYITDKKSNDLTTLQHTKHATATVVGKLIEQSVKLSEKKTIIGTGTMLVLSNRNIAYAITKTIGDAVRELPDRTPSTPKLAVNFIQNIGSEVGYNLTAQLVRLIAQRILPEGLVQTCIPDDYEPTSFIHDSIKYAIKRGISTTANYATHHVFIFLTSVIMPNGCCGRYINR